ncbi:unnamed protein product [Phytophthora lilii]|uniref:Unnamed protein product n=1 Tax=Phytophthora lilii TaxID=2077276 RepID=A0A9W6X6K4_9STRA|nr:unnamed protein product [Phytophthora lilii]
MAANEIFSDLNLVLQLNQHIQGVSITSDGARLRTPASPTGALAKQTSFKVLTNLESVSYSEAREDAQFDHQRSIFLSVSSCDLPFHLQGDKDFNEASAMAKRRALRFSESIKTRIEFLWEVAGGKKQAEMAQRIRQQQLEENEQGRGRRVEQSVRRTAANAIKQLLPPLEELDEEDYMALMLLIFKVLRDDFVLELAHKQIQCDWEVDSHHGKTLTFDQFFAAVFELVDVWTCDMEEATYGRFLHLLARRITRRVAVFLDGAELKLALSDNFEPEVVVKSIPLRTIPKFVSVARVVAATGMTTVGELARADPKIVERERVDFLQRNNGGVIPGGLSEMRKLGQDLRTLLAMFKSIALQFENINYALDNNVLRRLPSAAGPRSQPDDTRKKASETFNRTGLAGHENRRPERIHTNYSDANDEVRSLENSPAGIASPNPRSIGNNSNFSTKSDAETRQVQSTTGGIMGSTDGITRSVDPNSVLIRDSHASVFHDATPPRSSKGNTSTIDGNGNYLQPKTRARGASDNSSGYLPALNNIRDLQIAGASVVNALRSTFLIEKAISIERQIELPEIRKELVKFGVDVNTVRHSDEMIRDRYDALYDLLVLRDGESLKTLAGVMLEQIKFELSIHGIIVDDEEDVEEVYDGFFASVLTGTGDSIVQDAQRWMQGTVQENKVNNYIQHDFHELKSIDEVKLLGTKREDEEFLALLAKDAEVEDETAESINKYPGRKNSSPIQRKPSRAFAVPLPPVDTAQETESRPPGPVEESLPHSPPEQVAAPLKDDVDHSEKKKKTKRKKNGHEKISQTPVLQSLPVQPPAPAEVEGVTGYTHQSKTSISSRKPKLTVSTHDSVQADASGSNFVDENASLGPPIEATDASAPDDAKHNRPTMSRHGRPDTGLDLDGEFGEKGHHDTSDQHTARDALNVAIEFEDDETTSGTSAPKFDEERYMFVRDCK